MCILIYFIFFISFNKVIVGIVRAQFKDIENTKHTFGNTLKPYIRGSFMLQVTNAMMISKSCHRAIVRIQFRGKIVNGRIYQSNDVSCPI